MGIKKIRSCYISAPYGADISSIKSVLSKEDIDWKWAEELAYESEFSFQGNIKLISGTDLFILVLTDSQHNPDQYVELGVAVGSKKPIFIINSSERNDLSRSFILDSTLQVRTNLNDSETISYHLHLFLKSQAKIKFSHRRTSSRSFVSSDSNLDEVRIANHFESAFEKRVFEHFSELGGDLDIATVGQRERMSQSRYELDGIIWLQGEGFSFPEPALIEIKGNYNGAVQKKAVRQVSNYLENLRMRFGFIIFRGNRPIRCEGSSSGLIFILGEECLGQIIRDGNFYKSLKEARNRFVHGMG